MTKNDIDLMCKLYRDAKDKDAQIKIFVQIFLKPTDYIKDVLRQRGHIDDVQAKLYTKFKLQYDKGKTDYEIANHYGVVVDCVRSWRTVNNLRPNVWRRPR